MIYRTQVLPAGFEPQYRLPCSTCQFRHNL